MRVTYGCLPPFHCWLQVHCWLSGTLGCIRRKMRRKRLVRVWGTGLGQETDSGLIRKRLEADPGLRTEEWRAG